MAQAMDEAAALVTSLFEQYQTPICVYLGQLVDDQELANDLAQEAFLRLFRSRHQLARVENHRAWVYRIATNVAFDALRRRKRFRWLPWRWLDEEGVASSDPAEQAYQSIAVARALAALPPHYRAPLLLYSYYGWSVRDVAEALEISETAAKKRLVRAREMFRETYEGGEAE